MSSRHLACWVPKESPLRLSICCENERIMAEIVLRSRSSETATFLLRLSACINLAIVSNGDYPVPFAGKYNSHRGGMNIRTLLLLQAHMFQLH
jgi:hypothetical protein